MNRAGLTLIELLVVLLILSILTVVAVQSTDVLIDQGRFDNTAKLLQTVDEAIVGAANARDADGSLVTSGFVPDVGRIPGSLDELWQNSQALPPLSVQSTAIDPEIRLLCGWRPGGYLPQPVKLDGSADLMRDAWRNPLVYNGVSVLSYGADGKANGEIYDSDQVRALPPTKYGSTITGLLSLLDEKGQLRSASEPPTVLLYHPVNGLLTSTPASVSQTGTGTYSFSVATTIGHRIIRAYEGDAATATKKSRVISIVATPGPRWQPMTIQP